MPRRSRRRGAVISRATRVAVAPGVGVGVAAVDQDRLQRGRARSALARRSTTGAACTRLVVNAAGRRRGPVGDDQRRRRACRSPSARSARRRSGSRARERRRCTRSFIAQPSASGASQEQADSMLLPPDSLTPRAHAPWHFLYFLPLPHGQGSLRPTFVGVAALPSRPCAWRGAASPPPLMTICAGCGRRRCFEALEVGLRARPAR